MGEARRNFWDCKWLWRTISGTCGTTLPQGVDCWAGYIVSRYNWCLNFQYTDISRPRNLFSHVSALRENVLHWTQVPSFTDSCLAPNSNCRQIETANPQSGPNVSRLRIESFSPPERTFLPRLMSIFRSISWTIFFEPRQEMKLLRCIHRASARLQHSSLFCRWQTTKLRSFMIRLVEV